MPEVKDDRLLAAGSAHPELSASAVICTYGRPADLARCLEALAVQTRQPDAVIIVVRHTDHETLEMLRALADRSGLEDWPKLTLVQVTAPGLVAARNAGLAACESDIAAMVDDDTTPHPDWLERVVASFRADPSLGGVGGRDRCHDGARYVEGAEPIVGRVQWFGRIIGNHHIGAGPAREVAMLKGANMSYLIAAVAAIRFDERLRGSGAVPFEDIAISMAVRRAGWRLLYDPDIVVDHFCSPRAEPRYYAEVVPVTDPGGFRDYIFNGVVARWEALSPVRRLVFLLWSVLVGTRVAPGLVQAVRFTPMLGRESWRRFVLAMQGLVAGYRELLSLQRPVDAKGMAAQHRRAPPRFGPCACRATTAWHKILSSRS